MNLNYSWICAWIFLAGLTHVAAENFEDLQAQYETSLQLFEAKIDVQKQKLAGDYLKSIKTLKSKAQQAGNLERLQLMAAEEQLFASEGRTGDDDVKKSYPELYRVRGFYAKKRAALERAVARVRVSSTQDYQQALGRMAGTLTQQGRIEEAIVANDERKKVMSDDLYLAAKTLLQQKTTRPKGPGKAGPSQSENAISLHVTTLTGSGEKSASRDIALSVMIDGHPQKHPLDERGTTFKQLDQTNYFGPYTFKRPLDKVRSIVLQTDQGTDAVRLDEVSFQLFQGNRQSRPYTFTGAKLYSLDPEDEGAAARHVFKLPGDMAKIDQARTILLARQAFAITSEDQRREQFSVPIPSGGGSRTDISIGIGGGYDDTGDGAVRFKLLDHQGRVVKTGSAGEKDVKWIDCTVRSGTTCTLVVEDKDTAVSEGGIEGNWGTVEVLLR